MRVCSSHCPSQYVPAVCNVLNVVLLHDRNSAENEQHWPEKFPVAELGVLTSLIFKMLERANLFLPSLAAAALFFSAAIDALSCGFFVSAARCAANTASSSPKVIAESVALVRGGGGHGTKESDDRI